MSKYCEKCGCYLPVCGEKCPACGYNKETEIKHDKFLEATYMDIYEKLVDILANILQHSHLEKNLYLLILPKIMF